MVLANLKSSGARVTVLKVVNPFLTPNGVVSNAAILECNGLEAWAQRDGFIRRAIGRF
jgi:hypothetical protein